MVRYLKIILIFVVFYPAALYAKSSSWISIGGGYTNGFGGGSEFSLLKLSSSFPIGLHFGVGYFYQDDPGAAVDARKVFINDNTAGNDNILEYGYNIIFNLDFSYPLIDKRGIMLSPFLGVSHARYTAHFDYQGGNEAFDVSSNPWGINGGIRFSVGLSRSVMLVFKAGISYYFPSQISAHGNFYNPDGQDDNPRAPYTYTDADNSINQPRWAPLATLGVAFKL